MSLFLCLLLYRLFPYFSISISHLPGSLEKKHTQTKPPKIFSLFNFNLFMYYNSSFSYQSRKKSVENIYLHGKNAEQLVRHLSQHVMSLHLTICDMHWDCIKCFAFHSSPSIKIIASQMFSVGDKYSATTVQLSMTL